MRRVAVLLFLMLLSAGSMFAQSLSVKPGLWEHVMLGDDGKPEMKALNCITPTGLADMLASANKHPGCKITSQNMTSKSLTVDMACDRANVKMTSHGVLEAIDSEHMRSTTTVKMTMNGKTSETTAKSVAQFKSSSCGDVKPGDPKILN